MASSPKRVGTANPFQALFGSSQIPRSSKLRSEFEFLLTWKLFWRNYLLALSLWTLKCLLLHDGSSEITIFKWPTLPNVFCSDYLFVSQVVGRQHYMWTVCHWRHMKSRYSRIILGRSVTLMEGNDKWSCAGPLPSCHQQYHVYILRYIKMFHSYEKFHSPWDTRTYPCVVINISSTSPLCGYARNTNNHRKQVWQICRWLAHDSYSSIYITHCHTLWKVNKGAKIFRDFDELRKLVRGRIFAKEILATYATW